jgi:4-carboxymuconolactone decarboxylase
MLIVSREWTQQFEWGVHVPLGRKAGLSEEIIRAIGEGRRPPAMKPGEEVVYDFCDELLRTKGVCDFTYERAAEAFGEHGVIDILGVAGYFTTVSMVMNVAHTPAPHDPAVSPLQPFPS